MSALLLVAHGSRDARASRTVEALAVAVRRRRPGARVAVAYLDHGTTVEQALLGLYAEGRRDVVAVPLLLTAAYHSRIDLPAQLADASVRLPGLDVRQSDVLGPHPLLAAALERRVREAGVWPGDPDIGVVLAAAGSSDPSAIAAIASIASEWAASGWARVVPAFASAAAPTVPAAVAGLRRVGMRRVLVASYLLAPGRFAEELHDAGADLVTAPLGSAPEVAQLVLVRYDAAATHPERARVAG